MKWSKTWSTCFGSASCDNFNLGSFVRMSSLKWIFSNTLNYFSKYGWPVWSSSSAGRIPNCGRLRSGSSLFPLDGRSLRWRAVVLWRHPYLRRVSLHIYLDHHLDHHLHHHLDHHLHHYLDHHNLLKISKVGAHRRPLCQRCLLHEDHAGCTQRARGHWGGEDRGGLWSQHSLKSLPRLSRPTSSLILAGASSTCTTTSPSSTCPSQWTSQVVTST